MAQVARAESAEDEAKEEGAVAQAAEAPTEMVAAAMVVWTVGPVADAAAMAVVMAAEAMVAVVMVEEALAEVMEVVEMAVAAKAAVSLAEKRVVATAVVAMVAATVETTEVAVVATQVPKEMAAVAATAALFAAGGCRHRRAGGELEWKFCASNCLYRPATAMNGHPGHVRMRREKRGVLQHTRFRLEMCADLRHTSAASASLPTAAGRA